MLWYDYIGNGRSLKFSSMIITKDNEIIATRDAYWEEEGIFYVDDDDAHKAEKDEYINHVCCDRCKRM